MTNPLDPSWASPSVPRPTDSDVEAERYYGEDIPYLSERALTIEECRLTVQLAQLHPTVPTYDDVFEWLAKRRAAIVGEIHRRAKEGTVR